MAITVGTTNISPTQLSLLEEASQHQGLRVGEVLLRVVRDEDITQGREQLHPGWMELFEVNKAVLERELPGNFYKQLLKSFEEVAPLDTTLSRIDPKALAVTFLLGAGASKPAPSDIPTVKELLPHLLERGRRLDRDDVTKLAEFCERRKIDNIEDLLTAAQLSTFCSHNPTVLSLMNYLLYSADADDGHDDIRAPFSRRLRKPRDPIADLSSVAFLQDTLQVLFGLLSSTMLPAKPNAAHESIAKYAGQHKGAYIVTTNYDCCMDLALGTVGKDFDYDLQFANADSSRHPQSERTHLIKLHGSLNWYYCETCEEVQLVNIRQTVKDFLEDKSPYPVIGICKDCGGQRRGLLVPPLAMKFDVAPPLTPLLTQAEKAFEKSDLIVVVGFSFAEADVYISRMLSKSMQKSTKQKLIIVDPDGRVANRLKLKFKASIPNFDPTRIMRITGDCAELMPKFLTGSFQNLKKSKAKAVKSRAKKSKPRVA